MLGNRLEPVLGGVVLKPYNFDQKTFVLKRVHYKYKHLAHDVDLSDTTEERLSLVSDGTLLQVSLWRKPGFFRNWTYALEYTLKCPPVAKVPEAEIM